MSIDEVLAPLRSWSAEGRRAGVATLVRVRRSAPRLPGARFAVSEDGRLAGSVSSGCVEGDLHEHIGQLLAGGEPRLLHYGITDEMAADVGLACGGEIDVLVAPHDPASPVWNALGDVLDRRGAALLVTGLSEGVRGRVLLEEAEGRRFGGLGDAALDEAALEAARPLLATGGTEVVELEEPPAALFAEAFLPPPRLAIVGASPVAQALCRLAAWLGDEVTVVDPREAFADPSKFPGAARVVRAWPEEGLAEAGLDRWLDVVVLAHDRKLDVPALETALRARCRYVGQIGGSRTQRLRREALEERGLDEETIDRIRGPVGLDIGALGPGEIAVAILAELVAVRRGRA
ncbi:MAG: XdhC family protein [Candidatus Palauibacterales bacterium]|nr:XdhC family protein [Candidatus Palauibacterales bacterium]MDP2529693.1 XdhC family protein [Candidatus Palauibacterales bacterium]MDP2584109.1 XdhC family protein [Candidatus Palauibacterales bacterium]